jgi:hypothetical protein
LHLIALARRGIQERQADGAVAGLVKRTNVKAV